MTDFLILYASTHGHTAKIAERVAQTVRDGGAVAHVTDSTGAADLDLSDYDAVIVGASVHAGGHQREVRDWTKRHTSELRAMPSAFFSVCLTAADDTDESRAASRKYIDEFVEETGWTPDENVTFAGALQYREYDFATRLVMRLLMKHGHHETDTSKDHDYTDWDAVDRFGQECVAMVDRVATA
ncbi:MAG: menaquinone-dependent protoporphyrinogen oxidase [Thermoleophilaceae bacterium]|nr:menaquinone-dependent protoporphyrinogen oxidase [Thermoleophilaceae bacterium]